MNIVTTEDLHTPLPVQHLALGFFDGLHLGHRSVIQCGARTEMLGVLTFEPHPMAVIAPNKLPILITGFEHKTHLLQTWGVSHLLKIKFDVPRSKQTPEEFLSDVLRWCPQLKSVSAGYNWKFGQGRGGDIKTLRKWAKSHGLECFEVEPVLFDKEPISSTRIRQTIQAGDLTSAETMLGRPVTLYGSVVQGDQLGRVIGYPTANLKTSDECTPPYGVYAGYAQIVEKQERFPCAINIGLRPSIKSMAIGMRVEAHLLDFSDNLYGQTIALQFHKKLRDERSFGSIDELKLAIANDVETVRKMN